MFCQKDDSWFAGQRRNHEKLIQAPWLTQNLKKFQTRWVITIIVIITINVIITIYIIIVSRSIFFRILLNFQEGYSTNQGASKDGWSFEVKEHMT